MIRQKGTRLIPWLAVIFLVLGLVLMLSAGAHVVFRSGSGNMWGLNAFGTEDTPEPLIPTRTPEVLGTLPDPAVLQLKMDLGMFTFPPEERFRLGVSLPYGASNVYNLHALGVGWVMDWRTRITQTLPADVQYVQTVRMTDDTLVPDATTLTEIATMNPGAIWLISNEPDVRWQDNVRPHVYAHLYHDAYAAIKAGDASAIVAAGGIAQPTLLRLRYLDIIREVYQAAYGTAFPVDAWQIHNYILREERDSWGVDIPPGIANDTGVLYEIEDSGNLDIFAQHIFDFRVWMAARGYNDLPLIISEFGIPMPEDYGFPVDRTAYFLRETWAFFLTATDPVLGNPNDQGRLVQRWCWFSMGYPPYPTGDLVDFETGTWTPLGQVWLAYVHAE